MTRRKFISLLLVCICTFAAVGEEEPYINRKKIGYTEFERPYGNGTLTLTWTGYDNYLKRKFEVNGVIYIDQIHINSSEENGFTVYAMLYKNFNNITYDNRNMFYAQVRGLVTDTRINEKAFTEYDWKYRLYQVDKKIYKQFLEEKGIKLPAECPMEFGGIATMDTDGKDCLWSEKYLYIDSHYNYKLNE